MTIAEIKWKLVKDTYFFDTTTCYLSEDGNHMFYTGGEKRIKILIDDLNELVRKGCAIWLELGEYEFGFDRLSKCPTQTWYSIHQMLYSLEPWGVMKESKKSVGKSIKESVPFTKITWYDDFLSQEMADLIRDKFDVSVSYFSDFDEGVYGIRIKTSDYNSKILNFIKKKVGDVSVLEESKNSARKSIKESKTNYLTVEEFCNLCAKIFIHYEIWSFDGHNRYEESYDLSKIKSCPYKKYDVLMWDVQNDVVILYIENNAIPF
jgi:hypothetical protein